MICQAGTLNRTLRETNGRSQLYLSGSKAFHQIAEIMRLKNLQPKIPPDRGEKPQDWKDYQK